MVNFCALALHIYSSFDLCLNIYVCLIYKVCACVCVCVCLAGGKIEKTPAKCVPWKRAFARVNECDCKAVKLCVQM